MPEPQPPWSNLTLRVETRVLLWARTRAFYASTTVNALVRAFLAEYAAVPDGWPEVRDPRPASQVFAEVMEVPGAGHRARETHPPTLAQRLGAAPEPDGQDG